MALSQRQRLAIDHLSTENPIGIELLDPALGDEMINVSAFVDNQDGLEHNLVAQHLREIILAVLLSLVAAFCLGLILTRKELRRYPSCWLVVSVLVSILLHGAVILPIVHVSFRGWDAGLGACHVYSLFANFKTIHFQLSLLLLLIDRFVFFFAKPESHSEKMTPRVVLMLILVSVLFEFVVAGVMTYTLMKPVVLTLDMGMSFCTMGISTDQTLLLYGVLQIALMSGSVILGLVTSGCVLKKCMCGGGDTDSTRRSTSRQAAALIILTGFFNLGFSLPYLLFLSTGSLTNKSYIVFGTLSDFFQVTAAFLIMMFIPEIRKSMCACCRRKKEGEQLPLVRD